MQVLVTGATSFIGRALIPLLQREGHSVVAWVRSEARARSLHSFAADGERTVMEDRVYYAPPLGMFRLTAGCSQGKRPPERAKLPSASRPACLTRHGDHAAPAAGLIAGAPGHARQRGTHLAGRAEHEDVAIDTRQRVHGRIRGLALHQIELCLAANHVVKPLQP